MNSFKQKSNKFEALLLVTSFVTIFAFVAIDNVISPLIHLLEKFYFVAATDILKLVSICNAGVVVGTYFGPIFIGRFGVVRTYLGNVAVFLMTLMIFLWVRNFEWALALRFILGIGSGVFATLYWWFTFHAAISSKSKDYMISILLATRSLAIALGVPMLLFLSIYGGMGWQSGFIVLGILMLMINFIFFNQLEMTKDAGKSTPQHQHQQGYIVLTKNSNSLLFYAAIFFVAIPYFGFYSFSGYWYLVRLHFTENNLSVLFFIIGAIEVVVTFICPYCYKKKSSRPMMNLGIVLMILSYLIFFLVKENVLLSSIVIIFSLIGNRVLMFAFTKNIPNIFSFLENKAIAASAATLVSWGAFSVIAWVQSLVIANYSPVAVWQIMFWALIIGSLLTQILMKRVSEKNG
ncbi:MAG: MFS transporter [Oligoflexia bacterium]|nr:MFS transporter [Oligoflexia bacterium]MBF0367183.1 MFS transporter [Oligoflexia bacterium]